MSLMSPYKRWVLMGLVALLLLTEGAPIVGAQSGGGYSLVWSTIDSGGRTSTGGGYTLGGTIGQSDAGSAEMGGGYSVIGGFWALAAAASSLFLPFVSR